MSASVGAFCETQRSVGGSPRARSSNGLRSRNRLSSDTCYRKSRALVCFLFYFFLSGLYLFSPPPLTQKTDSIADGATDFTLVGGKEDITGIGLFNLLSLMLPFARSHTFIFYFFFLSLMISILLSRQNCAARPVHVATTIPGAEDECVSWACIVAYST